MKVGIGAMKFAEKFRGAASRLPRRLAIATIGAALLAGVVGAIGGSATVGAFSKKGLPEGRLPDLLVGNFLDQVASDVPAGQPGYLSERQCRGGSFDGRRFLNDPGRVLPAAVLLRSVAVRFPQPL